MGKFVCSSESNLKSILMEGGRGREKPPRLARC